MEVLLMDTNKINRFIAEKIIGLQPQVDFGIWDEHDWHLDENGDIDMFAMEYENHNGPSCKRCGYSYCHHCQDGPDRPCEIHVPEYTNSLILMWDVVAKLKEDFIVEISIGSESVECRLFKKDPDNDYALAAEADTVPLAICLAALKSRKEKTP